MSDTLMSAEAPFLTELFSRFNKGNVSYCVLRNYEALPYSLDGSDIDILFSPECFDEANSVLSQTAADYGGKCISEIWLHKAWRRSFCGFYRGCWWGVHFDTFSYAGTNGCEILPVKHMLNRSSLHNGIRVACASDSAIVAFLKEIIGAGCSRKDYAEKAAIAYGGEELIYLQLLKDSFGTQVLYEFILPLLSGQRIDLKLAQKALRSGSFRRRLSEHPVRAVLGLSLDNFYRVSRWFKPPGATLVVLGTDGSGKSTIIEGIRPPLESALHNKIHYEHLRPNLLPSIARLFGRSTQEGVAANPHASEPSGIWGSLLRLTYYSIDYILGYYIKVFPNLLRTPCLFVFDRYFYDFMIDPYRSRICLPKCIIKIFMLAIPLPDLILCLGTDPEVILARKTELVIEEVCRQLDELKRFSSKSANSVWIDTSFSVESSIHQALAAITFNMAKRF